MLKTEPVNPVLITHDQLQQAIGLKGFGGRVLTRLIWRILGITPLSALYARNAENEGPAFSEAVLKDLQVTFNIPESQLANIPAEGGFITVSNHHFGAIDGLLLNQIIGSRRPDYKILTTFFLALVPTLREHFIPVDNFASGGARSVSGIRSALGHIADGGALGLFPAGEVATWQRGKNRTSVGGGRRVVEDKPWADNMSKLIKKSGLPVIPIYFDGTNSERFHKLGRIHPRIRTLLLIRELLGSRGKHVEIRIGQPIPASQIAQFSVENLGKYLRNRCYALEAQCQPDFERHMTCAHEQEIAAPTDPELIRKQIADIEKCIIFESGGYRAYIIEESQAPDVMRELYRLREVTFRAVGEGTGKALDTDLYDHYYHHLILWHIQDEQLVGAYRVGYGSDIMAAHGGVNGFYTSTLVRFGADAPEMLSHSLELGRSFVVEKYQREVLPLKLLLAGLCIANVRAKADSCFGLVTMSAALPDFYKSLTSYFIHRDFGMPNADRFASPTSPFKPSFLRVNPEQLLQIPEGDIDAFDRLIGAMSEGQYRLPVLFRKYFSCGAHVACLNVDADFSDCVDAMIYLRLADFPPASIKSFVRGMPEETQKEILEHFYGSAEV
ncbi:MAG: lysophospholipid acyltransferase family protein [Bacteroidales bacterium]|nr:lysophospholipid acyltransferase family protein [Bacteroidales bacterium]